MFQRCAGADSCSTKSLRNSSAFLASAAQFDAAMKRECKVGDFVRMQMQASRQPEPVWRIGQTSARDFHYVDDSAHQVASSIFACCQHHAR